jgi:tetratricopeptide (TPR) repeat protein
LERERFGNDNPVTLSSLDMFALYCSQAGRFDKAISIYQETLDRRRQKFGRDHAETLSTVRAMGSAYERGGQIQECVLLLSDYGLYFDALEAARSGDHDVMGVLVEKSLAQDFAEAREPIDRVVIGELRLLGGDPVGAEKAIRAGMEATDPPPYMYKSLGLSLLAQGKLEQAKAEFRKALDALRQKDGSFDLENADRNQLTAAYFLDFVAENDYVAATKDDVSLACYPWFYVGQRKELRGDREGALAAYRQSVQLGKPETAEKTYGLAKWRLVELQGTTN